MSPNLRRGKGVRNLFGPEKVPDTFALPAELLSGDRPHIDPAPFAVMRF
jgi:hypothetical protein